MPKLIIQDSKLTTPIDVELNEGINAILDDSGTGKTYLMSLIRGYCLVNDLRCALINSYNCTFIKTVEDIDVLLLDNADLYATSEFLNNCSEHARYILCSIKIPLDAVKVPMYKCTLQKRESDGALEVKPYAVYF